MKRQRPDQGNAVVKIFMKVPSDAGNSRSYSINMPPKFSAALQAFVEKEQALACNPGRPDASTTPSQGDEVVPAPRMMQQAPSSTWQPASHPPPRFLPQQNRSIFVEAARQHTARAALSGMKRVVSATDLPLQAVAVREQHIQPQHAHPEVKVASPGIRKRSLPLTGCTDAAPATLPSSALQTRESVAESALPSMTDKLASLASIATEAYNMTDDSAVPPFAPFMVRNPMKFATLLS
jgi:hypothetical protein